MKEFVAGMKRIGNWGNQAGVLDEKTIKLRVGVANEDLPEGVLASLKELFRRLDINGTSTLPSCSHNSIAIFSVLTPKSHIYCTEKSVNCTSPIGWFDCGARGAGDGKLNYRELLKTVSKYKAMYFAMRQLAMQVPWTIPY